MQPLSAPAQCILLYATPFDLLLYATTFDLLLYATTFDLLHYAFDPCYHSCMLPSVKDIPGWAEPFLSSLRRTANVSASARDLGVSPSLIYALRKNNPTFAELFDDAMEEAYDGMEAEARRRAFDGVDEPVFYKGERVDTIKRYSDSMAIFLLKGYRRRVFGDTVAVTGPAGGALLIDETHRTARVQQILDAARKRIESSSGESDA